MGPNIIKSGVSSVSQKSIPATTEYANLSQNQPTASEVVVKNSTADEATDNLGKSSIVIFVAFSLSTIAGMLGAFFAKTGDETALKLNLSNNFRKEI